MLPFKKLLKTLSFLFLFGQVKLTSSLSRLIVDTSKRPTFNNNILLILTQSTKIPPMAPPSIVEKIKPKAKNEYNFIKALLSTAISLIITLVAIKLIANKQELKKEHVYIVNKLNLTSSITGKIVLIK